MGVLLCALFIFFLSVVVEIRCIPSAHLAALLVIWVQVAGLTNLFNSERAVRTILAPNDAAFVALLQQQGIRESQLLAQEAKLRRLLLNHVILGQQVQLDMFQAGQSFPTANTGQVLTVTGPVEPFVVDAGLQACNTLIHEFAIVLVPQDILPLGPAPLVTTTAADTTNAAAASSPSPGSNAESTSGSSATVGGSKVQAQVAAASPSTQSFALDVTKVDVDFSGSGSYGSSRMPFSG
jgi:hypothetical protein